MDNGVPMPALFSFDADAQLWQQAMWYLSISVSELKLIIYYCRLF
jgi:hypothetical protein